MRESEREKMKNKNYGLSNASGKIAACGREFAAVRERGLLDCLLALPTVRCWLELCARGKGSVL